MSPRPILLLSAGRAGSNLMKSFFRPNPSILDVGEFLHPDSHTHDPRYAFWSPENSGWAERLALSRPDPRAPFAIFRAYAEWLVAEAGQRALFADLKYHNAGPVDALWRHVDQPPPPLAAFLSLDATIIHLVRRNPLALHCSLERAIKTGEWVKEADPVDESKGYPAKTRAAAATNMLVLDTRHLLDTLRRISFRSDAADLWIDRYRRRLRIAYEDILEGDRLAPTAQERIAALAGCDLDLSGRPLTVKVAPPLSELIENLDEVRNALAKTEFAWCIDADPAARPGEKRGPDVRLENSGRRSSYARATPTAKASDWRKRSRIAAAGSPVVVLLARELPQQFGLGVDLAAVANLLERLGFRPVLALPDAVSSAAPSSVAPAQLQSPLWPAIAAGNVAPSPRNHADMLETIGCGDPTAVAAMVAAWRGLIGSLRPQVVVADHAPGLIVATRGGDCPVIAVGDAITLPPITVNGFPRLFSARGWHPPVQRMVGALSHAGPMARSAAGLSQIFDARPRLVIDLPELDPYQTVRDELLALPTAISGRGRPANGPRRLLAALPPGMPRRDKLLSAIRMVDPAAVISDAIHSEGIGRAMAQCSHVCCLAGSVASTAALTSGRPQILITGGGWIGDLKAEMLDQQGAARAVNPALPINVLIDGINAILLDTHLLDRATLLAERIASRRRPDGMEMLADLVASAALDPASPENIRSYDGAASL